VTAREAAEAVARRSYGKLVALLAARTRDVAGAEDALSEELEAAAAAESEIPDERLALMFACAHPALDPKIRAPLILQTILGFDAAAVGSAFLISPATMAQRLVRAKQKIREAGIPLAVPEGAGLAERLTPVLEAIYTAFAEGWSDPTGADAKRRNLADEGIWLGRLVASLLPEEAEALGLLSLMLHAQARREARRDGGGEYVPLGEQDPERWDAALIDEAEALLARASALPGASGRYQLEAAVQSAHAVRRKSGRSDWSAIERIYDALLALTGSPVVAVNRAVALAETRGPDEALAALGELDGEKRLADYQPYWAARAGMLARTGNASAADEAYERAIGLEGDPAVRRFLSRKRAELRS
jgi:RNA polymerase sigma-70 factor, ECF subfamily